MSFHFCLFPTSTLACHTPLECRSPLPAPGPYLCTGAQGKYWQMQEVVFQPLQGFVDYIYHCPYAHIGLGKNSSGFFCNTVWKNPVNILANPIQEYLVINTYGLRNGIRAWTDLILNYGGMKCLTTGLLCLWNSLAFPTQRGLPLGGQDSYNRNFSPKLGVRIPPKPRELYCLKGT